MKKKKEVRCVGRVFLMTCPQTGCGICRRKRIFNDSVRWKERKLNMHLCVLTVAVELDIDYFVKIF